MDGFGSKPVASMIAATSSMVVAASSPSDRASPGGKGLTDAVLASMDDESVYGPELHRLGFGDAVERDLLTDYRVLVLAVDVNIEIGHGQPYRPDLLVLPCTTTAATTVPCGGPSTTISHPEVPDRFAQETPVRCTHLLLLATERRDRVHDEEHPENDCRCFADARREARGCCQTARTRVDRLG